MGEGEPNGCAPRPAIDPDHVGTLREKNVSRKRKGSSSLCRRLLPTSGKPENANSEAEIPAANVDDRRCGAPSRPSTAPLSERSGSAIRWRLDNEELDGRFASLRPGGPTVRVIAIRALGHHAGFPRPWPGHHDVRSPAGSRAGALDPAHERSERIGVAYTTPGDEELPRIEHAAADRGWPSGGRRGADMGNLVGLQRRSRR